MTTFLLLNQWLSRKVYLPVSTFVPTMTKVPLCRSFCTNLADSEMVDLVEYLDSLKNYEKSGVPQNAGTDSDDGFDLSRMRRLMDQLGNPESNYKIVHIAGTKGKGSTAAFLSNILRAEGYSVGCYTSPHIRSIRERMSVGGEGEPVSAKELDCVFRKIKRIMDQAVQSEHGHLSHFEVLTAIAFTLFADRNVDIAVVEAGLGGARDATNVIRSSKLATAIITTIGKEHLAALGGSLESIAFAKSGIIKNGCPVILGGPFLPQIENIIRNKASLMCSPVVSSFDSGNVSAIKGLHDVNGIPRQSCDIVIQIEKDIPLSVELLDLKLSMLGYHQLQNAVTATCAALCLRHQGWRIRESSIRSGLENTQLLGRSQFLKPEEVEALGLHGSTILLDGAHTQESAKALVDTIVMARPGARLVLVVAMASDKDHIGFAKELLSGLHLEAVFLTEVHIAGDKSRTASALFLKECWTRASAELGIDSGKMILDSEKSLITSLRTGDEIIRSRKGEEFGMILVTGSLHIVSSVLASISC